MKQYICIDIGGTEIKHGVLDENEKFLAKGKAVSYTHLDVYKRQDLRIYEVARSVGIEDPNYFSKFFKKHTQETPAQYRDRCQEAL